MMKDQQGLTLLEILFVAFVLIVLVAMLLPQVSYPKRASIRASNFNNLKQIGLGLEMYMADDCYGMAPPHVEGEDYSVTVMGALYKNGDGLIGDYKCFQNPLMRHKVGKRPEGACDYIFSPLLAKDNAPDMVVACDKPGIWDEGGTLLFRDSHVKFFRMDEKNYAMWVSAFEHGDINAMKGPEEWLAEPKAEAERGDHE
ncbi:MAG: type II secretion system protein [Planctomycetes bacterium]|nr:type II secretion system protein [Planctomycetota bacterium]